MKPIEIIFNVVSMVLAELSAQMVVKYLYPKFKKKALEDEEKAKQCKYVKMNKNLISVFIALSIFTSVIGMIIFAFPDFITEVLGFDYIATIVVWWIPLLFDDTVLYFMLTQVSYNDEEIVVKKALGKPKTYKFSEIISFTESGNLRVKTTKGKFALFNAMAGTETLRNVMKAKAKNSVSAV